MWNFIIPIASGLLGFAIAKGKYDQGGLMTLVSGIATQPGVTGADSIIALPPGAYWTSYQGSPMSGSGNIVVGATKAGDSRSMAWVDATGTAQTTTVRF
jgi:hypothetical protein